MTQCQRSLVEYFDLLQAHNPDYFEEMSKIKFSDLFRF